MSKIKIRVLTKDDKYIPSYATQDSAGADLKAQILDEIELAPGSSSLVPTGIFFRNYQKVLVSSNKAKIRSCPKAWSNCLKYSRYNRFRL